MTINKFTGKTEEEAMEKVRKELGNAAVIMNVKVVKPKGFTGIFKSNTYEVTAAVEDEGFSNDAKTFAIPTAGDIGIALTTFNTGMFLRVHHRITTKDIFVMVTVTT